MKRGVLILLSLFLVSVIMFGCKAQQNVSNKDTGQKTLSELQIEACNSAHAANTCNTRLQELGIVLKEDCCEVLGKCC